MASSPDSAGDPRWTWREAGLLALASLAISCAINRHVLQHFGEVPLANDWDHFMHLYWATAQSVLKYHQFPSWDPWVCGGTPLQANPQSHVFTPFLLLHLLFGPARGVELEIVVHGAIAIAGGYVLARSLGLSRIASCASAMVLPSSSALPLHLGEGHGWALAYAYMPWVLAFALLAVNRPRWLFAALSGAALALTIDEGGVYPAPHTALLLGLVLGLLALQRRSIRPLSVLAAIGAVAFLLSAIQILPALELMSRHPRFIESPEVSSASTLIQSLFGWNQDRYRGDLGLPWGFHEYGAYLSPLVALLALAGACFDPRRTAPWIIVALVLLSLAVGSPTWTLLHHLPLFSSQHVPSRFLIPFLVVAGLLASAGIDAVAHRWHRLGLAIALGLLVAGAFDGIARGSGNLEHAFERSDDAFEASPTFRQYFDGRHRDGHFANMYSRGLADLGAVDCYQPVHLDTAARPSNRPGYEGEQYLQAGAGQIAVAGWSPNELQYDVDLTQPSMMAINQNFDPNWRLVQGDGSVVPLAGIVGVVLPAGAQHLRLRYQSRALALGLALSVIGTLLLVALGWQTASGLDPDEGRLQRRRWKTGLLMAGLLAAAGEVALALESLPPSAHQATSSEGASTCAPFPPVEASPGPSAAVVCSAGKPFDDSRGASSIEVFSACAPGSTRAGWHWHLWCRADQTSCRPLRSQYLAEPPSNLGVEDYCSRDEVGWPGRPGETRAW